MASSGGSDEFDVSTAELDALVQDAEFFRSLVENGSDAIVSVDEDSTIVYANQSVERVFGYTPEELIGEKLTIIMPDRFHADHFEALNQYLDTGERGLDWNNVELPAEHSDGHEIPLSITFEEHSYEGRRLFSGIMRDITDRVERERQLEQQNERLERFASVVSHDLRDPLQTARATLAVARAGDEEALDELVDIFDRMDELIGDVLTLAKEGRAVGETEPVALDGVVADAWSTIGADTASLDVAESLPTVSADPERLRTLFENLFHNSVAHGGPSVTVTVGPLNDGFFVADNGSGFEDADIEALFDYGYTTDEDGTGFGLSIVDEIARAHGWTVTVTTGEAGGARFEIEPR